MIQNRQSYSIFPAVVMAVVLIILSGCEKPPVSRANPQLKVSDTAVWIARGDVSRIALDPSSIVKWPVAEITGVLYNTDTIWDEWREQYFTILLRYVVISKEIDTMCYEFKDCDDTTQD